MHEVDAAFVEDVRKFKELVFAGRVWQLDMVIESLIEDQSERDFRHQLSEDSELE